MKVFSIVVTFNGEKWVEKCFGSLVNSSIDDHTILCIDNGSTDSTVALVRHKFPNVQIIEKGENLGFGKANNIGLKKALDEGADFVFLLNQDAWIANGTINKLVEAIMKNPSFAILSPVHLNGKGDAYDHLFEKYQAKMHHLADEELYYKVPFDQLAVIPVAFVNAALWLMSRKVLETVGGFNPFFFLYGEDREYISRCRHFDLKIGIVPEALGWHDRSKDYNRQKKLAGRRSAIEARLLDPGKSYSRFLYLRMIFLRMMKYILLLRFDELKDIYSLIGYFKMKEQEIKFYREITSRPGRNFI